MKLIIECVAWSATPCARRIATLRHKVRNNAVERHTIVESLTSEGDKVIDRGGHLVAEQLEHNVPLGRGDSGYMASDTVESRSHCWQRRLRCKPPLQRLCRFARPNGEPQGNGSGQHCNDCASDQSPTVARSPW